MVASPTRIRIPHDWEPRVYQVPVLRAFDRGTKRFVLVWHRRSGKDSVCFNLMVMAAVDRVGNYYYIFPQYSQGKKALWDAVQDGKRAIDHCPPALVAQRNHTEMKLTLVNGSTIQIVGSDNVDTLVGTNPVGLVFSEYSLQSPLVWQFLRPIVIENGGWVVFNFTPRGANHAQDLYELARADPAWFCTLLTAEQTGVFSPEQLAAERAEMSEEVYLQEYMCDFEAGNEGSYYGRLLADARADGRIGRVPAEPGLPVHTAWDLGVGDSTAIWFYQVVGRERRYVDYYESSGEGLPHYVHALQRRPYVYGKHFAPHDIEVREFSSGTSRRDTARALGIRFEVIPQHSLEDGIEASRLLLPRCWFDAERCKDGIAALRAYAKVFDERHQTWRDRPAHTWASHAADAFRYSAMANVERAGGTFTRAPTVEAAPWRRSPPR
jgi:hypothetical protein